MSGQKFQYKSWSLAWSLSSFADTVRLSLFQVDIKWNCSLASHPKTTTVCFTPINVGHLAGKICYLYIYYVSLKSYLPEKIQFVNVYIEHACFLHLNFFHPKFTIPRAWSYQPKSPEKFSEFCQIFRLLKLLTNISNWGHIK